MYIFTNGTIVLPDQLLKDHAVVVEAGRIKAIIPEEEVPLFPEAELLDAGGGYISPGFIDIHSDYIEKIAAPRPTAVMNFEMAIKECERIIITHGITTMFHSLSLHNGNSNGNPIRKPSNSIRLMESINATRDRYHLIRHRVHARLEISSFEMVEPLQRLISEDKIQLLSLMDHTPGQGQYHDIKRYRQYLNPDQKDMDEEAYLELIRERQSQPVISEDVLRELAELAQSKGIALASHDDDSAEKIEKMSDWGATISEFPINLGVAKKARDRGLWTIGGAPNILLGGSHSGNLSAADGIREGVLNVMCSDYYPPSLVQAVFKMYRNYGLPLEDLFALLTINPARAAKIDDEVGSIEVGKKADLLIVIEDEKQYPMILNVMVDGVPVYQTVYRL